MAQVEEAIYTAAKAHSGLTALIGAGDNCRIYPEGEVEDTVTLPYVTFQRVSGHREHTMVSDLGLASPHFQFSIWAETYNDAKTVAAQVRDCFQDWSGTVAGVTVQRAFFEGDYDLYDPEVEIHQVAMAFIIWHAE